MTEAENKEPKVQTEGEFTPENLPKAAWNIQFVAIMTAPVQQTGRYYSKEPLSDEEGLEAFKKYITEDLGLENFKIESFDRVEVDPTDFIKPTVEAPTSLN